MASTLSQTNTYPLPSFEECLKHALRLFDTPAKLGAESSLATPYFLSNVLTASSPGDANYMLGEALREQILLAAAKLWDGPLPSTVEEMRTALLKEREVRGTKRYSYLLLELRYFHRFFHPRSLREIYENPEYLIDSKSGDNRSFRLAVQHLAEVLTIQLQPTLRPEKPLSNQPLVGYEDYINRCLACFENTTSGSAVTVSITGSSGTGKSSLGAEIAARSVDKHVFWYTIRPTFNDRLGSLLFSLGSFLYGVGGLDLWRMLIASGGAIAEPSVAAAALFKDLDTIGNNNVLICIDELDLIASSDFNRSSIPHQQLLEFFDILRDKTNLLLIGQRPLIDADEYVTLTGLALDQIAAICARSEVYLPNRHYQKLHRFTNGNPRLVQLLISLYKQGQTIDDLLPSSSTAIGLIPLLKKLLQRLSPFEREILQQLSVFRSPVPIAPWGHDGTDKENGSSALTALTELRIINQADRGVVELVPVVRMTIYNLLPQEHKEQFHLVAAGIRQQQAEYTAAAYHYWQSNHVEHAIHTWFPHRALEIQRGHAEAAYAIFHRLSQKGLSLKEQKALTLIRAELSQLLGMISEGLDEIPTQSATPADEISLQVGVLRGEFEEALGYTEESLQTFEDVRKATMELLKTMATLHHKRGLLLLRQRELADSIKEADSVEFVLHTLRGELCEEEGRYFNAEQKYQKALTIAESLGNGQDIALAYRNLADIYGRQQNYDKAMASAQQALAQYNKIGDRWHMEGMRSNMAFICIQTGRFNEAIEYAKGAYQFFESAKASQYIAVTAGNLADAYVEVGNWEEAEYYAEIVLQQEDRFTQPYAYFTLGRIAHNRHEYSNAIAHLSESIYQADVNQDLYLEAYAQREIGTVYALVDNEIAKRESLSRALQLFQRLDMDIETLATRKLMN